MFATEAIAIVIESMTRGGLARVLAQQEKKMATTRRKPARKVFRPKVKSTIPLAEIRAAVRKVQAERLARKK